jgi:hypothetical protein
MSRSSGDRLLRRAVRGFLLGSGPLKRTSDRLQMAGRLLVVLTLLAAVPLAVLVTGIARGRLEATAAAQAAERHEVRAVVLKDHAIPPPSSGDGVSAAPFSIVRAEIGWHGPGGAVRRATLMVPAGTAVGSTVPVWIDRSGRLAAAPADRSTIRDNALVMGLSLAIGIPLTAWGLHCGLCVALDAHRTRRWGRDWARVEREWRARLS